MWVYHAKSPEIICLIRLAAFMTGALETAESALL
jgi:hypothetical protein